MEDLTKHQLILITLLISFVTSIATGIMTFTLLSEAPVEVTQTINRVVERTIQQVAPATDGQSEKVVTTVVVNEEDQIQSSISKNEKSIVRMTAVGADGSGIFSGIGIVISSDGVVAADIRSYTTTPPAAFVFYDGRTYPTGKVFIDEADGLVFIKVNVPVNDDSKYAFYPATFGDSDSLKIGQTLIAISGQESNAASIGRIFQLVFGDDKKTVKSIISDIKVTKTNLGSPVMDLSGEIVGMEAPLTGSETEYSYIPVNIIKAATPKALENLAK